MPHPTEKEAKLRHYADMYGDWIYELSPTEAKQYSGLVRQLSKLQKGSPQAAKTLCTSVHFESISDCLAARQAA